MKISDSGLAALKREEGCKLTAYTDSRGVWTIGTGHTGRVDGVAVGKNMTITQDTADRLLRDDLSWEYLPEPRMPDFSTGGDWSSVFIDESFTADAGGSQ